MWGRLSKWWQRQTPPSPARVPPWQRIEPTWVAQPDDLPESVGPYQIERLLGRGGMAQVYLGRDEKNQSAAVKVIRSELARDDDFLLRFQREVEMIRGLRHDNLVHLYGSGANYLAMEWVDGPTLDDILDQEKLELADFKYLAGQLCAGLHFAHTRQLFHRDIKPGNIMITREGAVKIVDFGLAIEVGQSRLTHPGFSMGTPTHMAPEMLTDGQASPASDQYELGVVFFQMVTGQLPFQHHNPVQLGWMQIECAPPSPRELRPDLDPEWEIVILRMLSKRPEQRYQSLLEVAQSLA